ncbi:MAG TPA: hypothetical protein VF669_13430 [Tepidisphaeraceae bacterium]|jgi:hypothetical protein
MARFKIFLLSPARCDGERAKLLFRPEARFELAMKLRTPQGATLGQTFSFLSGLYFRGKLAYAKTFGKHGSFVITTDRGLVSPDELITLDDLRAMAGNCIDTREQRYRGPLERDVKGLPSCDVVLLGSVASGKYVDILLDILGPRLKFPAEFVGRGDMSRGGLLLRCVEERRELTYVPVKGAVLNGKRPPKLAPKPGIMSRVKDD